MKNKIITPKNLTNQQKCDIDWIINVLTKSTKNSISSVNIYFNGFDIKFNYKIKIKLRKNGKK